MKTYLSRDACFLGVKPPQTFLTQIFFVFGVPLHLPLQQVFASWKMMLHFVARRGTPVIQHLNLFLKE